MAKKQSTEIELSKAELDWLQKSTSRDLHRLILCNTVAVGIINGRISAYSTDTHRAHIKLGAKHDPMNVVVFDIRRIKFEMAMANVKQIRIKLDGAEWRGEMLGAKGDTVGSIALAPSDGTYPVIQRVITDEKLLVGVSGSFRCNGKYLHDACSVFPSYAGTIRTQKEPTRPIVITAYARPYDSCDHMAVVMPMSAI